MKHSLQTRAAVARLLREGKSYGQIAAETGTSKATIKRWAKDPDFLNLIDGAGLLTLGHVELRAAEGDLLEEAPSEESWVWIGEDTVLGSLLVEGARHLRAVFLTSPERVETVREELAKERLPALEAGDLTTVLVPEALPVLQEDPEALELLTRICTGTPAESFRAFLSLWSFRAQETKDVRLLGEHLWPAQETFISEIAEHPHLYALKARKLGQSTIGCAYAAYCQ